MSDIRDKIVTISGFKGHGAVARAAEKLGVSQRTLHRAMTSGPSAKLREIIDAAEEAALMEMGCGSRAYEAELAAHAKAMAAYVKRIKGSSRKGSPVEEQLRTERMLGYADALVQMCNKKNRRGWLMYVMKNFAAQIQQPEQPR
ncbi:hypothetical protein [Paracoccus sp. SSK6]|uniref:hypothetical protein n=1 Tax=Paracoccus sp. SSK6 TaxID=3143131 RepID=UPI0032196823